MRPVEHGAAAKPLFRGRGERAATAGRDKRGMGKLNPLEEYSFPPSNLSCDVVAPALLRTQALRGTAAFKAVQMQQAPDCSSS